MVSGKGSPRAAWPLHCVLVAALVVAGCSTPKSYLARSVAESNPTGLPKKILLVPPEVSVVEVTVGGVGEKDSAWSRQARDNIIGALKSQARDRDLELVEMPSLTQEEKDDLDRHVAMFELVTSAASQYALSTDSVWRKRSPGLHYTVGPGLRFLAERTGADAALIVSAEDAVSTTGRIAVLAATILLFGVPALPPGYSFLAAGVVELTTGNLLWHDFDWNVARRDLRKEPDAAGLVSDVFGSFPANGKPKTAQQ